MSRAALDTERVRCIPHALSTLVKHKNGAFDGASDLTSISSLIYAGGATSRAAELESNAYNLKASSINFYSNRFASFVPPICYLSEDFPAVSRWLQKSITLSKIKDDEKDNDDDKSDDGDTKEESPVKLCRRVLEAYMPKSAPITLQIMATALEKIPQLIVDMSKSKGNIRPKMGEQLEVLRKTLDFMTDQFGATTAVNRAMHTVEARRKLVGMPHSVMP